MIKNVEIYATSLEKNLNYGSNIYTRNIRSKKDYYPILFNIVNQLNKYSYIEDIDKRISVIKEYLFYNYTYDKKTIQEILTNLVGINKPTPSLNFAFGNHLTSYQGTIGNRQEVRVLDKNVINEIIESDINTIYDAHSTSKLFFTITTLLLHNNKIIDLNENVSKYSSRFHINSKLIDLMSFTVPLKTRGRIDSVINRESALETLYSIDITDDYNCIRYPYTDMGILTLKQIIEDYTNREYGEFVYKYIIEKLKLKNTYVSNVPLHNTASTTREIHHNLTGINTYFTPLGIVNDRKARILSTKSNQMQGFAGIFTNINDLSILCQSLLKGELLNQEELYNIGKNNTGRKVNDNEYIQFFGLGVFTKNPTKKTEVPHICSGRAFSSPGIGGSYVLIDYQNDFYIAILSNKTHNRVITSPLDGCMLIDKDLFIINKDYTSRLDDLKNILTELNIAYNFLEQIYDKKSKTKQEKHLILKK